jgi:hypothetical protein
LFHGQVVKNMETELFVALYHVLELLFKEHPNANTENRIIISF